MLPGGHALPSQPAFFWQMGETSNERLRTYLGQLPPRAQALLMREFERAIERGEDTAVATLVLEQLRRVVRGNEEDSRPRTGDPARWLFRPLEPFLAENNMPVRMGQIRRTSLESKIPCLTTISEAFALLKALEVSRDDLSVSPL